MPEYFPNLPESADVQILTTGDKRALRSLKTGAFAPIVRPPFVTFLKAATITKAGGDWDIAVSWVEPVHTPYPIQGYRVYATSAVGQPPTLVAYVTHSPARFYIRIPASSQFIFTVQTVLANGTANDLSQAPTTAL